MTTVFSYGIGETVCQDRKTRKDFAYVIQVRRTENVGIKKTGRGLRACEINFFNKANCVLFSISNKLQLILDFFGKKFLNSP